MAMYHFTIAPVQKSKGHSAVARAANRSGTRLRDWQTGKAHDYRRRQDVVTSTILTPDNAPAWARNREELWNRAEAAEKRKDAQPAREIRLALPEELTDGQRADLVLGYVNGMFVNLGMVADIGIYRPGDDGDGRNHHANILLTMRGLDGDKFARTKQREWGKIQNLRYWREQWANYQNRALEEAGSDARVDHRSLEARGIDREVSGHMGMAATAMERKGKRTRIGDGNREIVEQNRAREALVNELAAVEAEISALSGADDTSAV
jgi:ATP-dependent exoDNAse (exonuclease V) alpha subunit